MHRSQAEKQLFALAHHFSGVFTKLCRREYFAYMFSPWGNEGRTSHNVKTTCSAKRTEEVSPLLLLRPSVTSFPARIFGCAHSPLKTWSNFDPARQGPATIVELKKQPSSFCDRSDQAISHPPTPPCTAYPNRQFGSVRENRVFALHLLHKHVRKSHSTGGGVNERWR